VPAGRVRLGLLLLLAALAGWLGLRAVAAFDADRHRAEAASLLRASDLRSVDLPPVSAGGAAGASGRFQYRQDGWLSVVRLRGLPPVEGNERYLVFLRNWGDWTLAGVARPDRHGEAEVRFAAEPRPRTVYEVIVTRDVDNAVNFPHGEPLLHWYDPSRAPRDKRPFDFSNPQG
jgi:hypothetical protein